MDDNTSAPDPGTNPPSEEAGAPQAPPIVAEPVPAPEPTPPPDAAYTPPAPLPAADPTPTEPRTHGVSVGGAVAIALVCALFFGGIAGAMAGFAGSRISDRRSGIAVPDSITVIPSETEEPVVAAAAAALPSVVNIDVSGATVTDDSGELPQGHPGVPMSGNGSGVAWMSTDDGGTYILTNNHVVEDVSSIVVTGADRERYDAELVGTDPDTDIAVIRIDAELPLIKVADSGTLSVGQAVVAIGSPYGLSQSVSAGVVSALGRSLPNSISDQQGLYPLVDVIQTDAAINPGNSGGALVDRFGELVGINTAIYSDSGASGGIGFAVPSAIAVRIASDLIDDGTAEHPFLGILGRDVDSILMESEGLSVDEGAYIVEITSGTEAEKSDLEAGDVVVLLDDDAIRSMDDLILQVRRREIGDTVVLTVYRGEEQYGD